MQLRELISKLQDIVHVTPTAASLPASSVLSSIDLETPMDTHQTLQGHGVTLQVRPDYSDDRIVLFAKLDKQIHCIILDLDDQAWLRAHLIPKVEP